MKKLGVIMLLGVFAALVWEFIIPLFKPSSVTDPNDLICYLIGTMVYYLIRKITIKY